MELTLDDGTKVEARTSDAGLGWPSVVFLLFVPDERQVAHVDARSSDGTLIYTRDLEEVDGSYPGRAHGVFLSDYSVCGPDPQPQ